MNIDIECLGNDIAYWNGVAPEGAECLIGGNRFAKWVGDIEFAWDGDNGKWGKWIISSTPWSLEKYINKKRHNIIMKPTPLVLNEELLMGTVCEAIWDTNKNEWYNARIVGKDGQMIIGRWLEGPSYGSLFEYHNKKAFRPIKTPEHIHRDEMINAATKVLEIKFGSPRTLYISYCESLYDVGMLC